MIKLFSQTDNSFSSNGDKIIIPTKAKVHKEDDKAILKIDTYEKEMTEKCNILFMGIF